MNSQTTTQEIRKTPQTMMQSDSPFENCSERISIEVMRRFYHVRESGKTGEYYLSCGIKQFVLEQKGMAQFISVSSNTNLENLVNLFPDTGAFNVLEQEYHDMKQSSTFFGEKYQRDHFLILEGTGEELAMAEQFFSGNGYRYIDAKICEREEKLKQYLMNMQPFHVESVPSIYTQFFTKTAVMKKHMTSHLNNQSELYFGLGVIIGLVFGAYTFLNLARASSDEQGRGVVRIMHDDFFGRKTSEIGK